MPTSGNNSNGNSARTSSVGRRADYPAARPPPSSALPTPPNASPKRGSSRLRELDASPARSAPSSSSHMFPTPVSLPLYSDHATQFLAARKRSPAPPPLPMDLLLNAAPQPIFDALMMGPIPPHLNTYDMAKVIVQLETSTSLLKTTLQTLLARPSHLATYLIGLHTRPHASLLDPSPSTLTLQDPPLKSPRTPASAGGDDEDCASVYSERSEFFDSDVDVDGGAKGAVGLNALLHDHAPRKKRKPEGSKLKQRSSVPVLHLFLDRPSAP